MAITGISSYDGKQIIAAGAQSAISAGTASDLVWTAGISSNAGFFTGNQYASGGFYVESKDGTMDVEICPNYILFSNSTYSPVTSRTIEINSGKVAKWDSLSADKQDKLTFGYTDDQISQINGSAIYSQGGGGGGVVTATGGTTTYIQTINNKNISATNAGSALSATDAYNLTNTAIKVASATSASTAYTLGNTAIKVASAGSASTAYTLGNTAIKVASATSATNANTATYASNGVSLTNIYNSAGSGYRAFTALTGISGYVHYYQSVMGNWWNSTASNPLCIKINTANFCTGGAVSDAHLFLKQLAGVESAYTATMKITNFKTDAQWTTKEIATFGGGVYDETHTINPQYLLWNGNVVFNAWHGGWNQSITGVFLGGTWTSTGQDLMLNITGIVSK